MSDLVNIQNQIAALQKQADAIRAEQFDKTVQEILEKMAAFGITVHDLAPSKGRARKAASVGGKSAPVKFRGPSGETWSGRGLMPRWLSALVATGKHKEDYAVEG